MRAIGVASVRSNPAGDASSSIEAPSFIGDELPAVTVPPSVRNTGFSAASLARVVSALMHSSRASSLPATGTTSASNHPAAHA